MTKYTKDDINFHGFLAAVRRMQNVSLRTLARGLYSATMMNRVEKGERLPKKLERDRIVARLGVSGEGYEDYLSIEEYAEWELRQDIIKSVEERDVTRLEEQLAVYETTKDITKVELQFLESMRFMLLKMKHSSEDELRKVIELAVSYTIPNIEDGFPRKLLLADQEINLLIEYVSLHHYGTTEEECRKWRIARYEDIITYIDESCIDNIGKAKVYPKLVYYICRESAGSRGTVEEILNCMNLCNDAIELLRDTRKMYYMVELLELRQVLIGQILELSTELSTDETEEIGSLLNTSKDWEELLKELYEEYHVAPYMENYCYLYLETESYCVNDVIRLRRKMLNLTQKALAEDVCDEKTVGRIEQKKISPQMYVVRGLFGKLGLCPEYVRANVITCDPKVKALHMRVARYSNERNVEMWNSSINELESKLCMDIIQNKQAVMREKILLDMHVQKITREEAIEELTEVLELTVPINRLFKSNKLYLTIEEITLLHNIAGEVDKSIKNIYRELLKRYCEQEIEENSIQRRLSTHELLIQGIANYLGNIGLYDESNRLIDQLIHVELENRRMRSLAKNLYINCWNNYNIDGGENLARDNSEVDNTLHKCILLSDMMNNKRLSVFFAKKLSD